MSWFGKMVGGTIGLVIGGPLGAIAGGAIGHHLFDKGSSESGGRSGGWGGNDGAFRRGFGEAGGFGGAGAFGGFGGASPSAGPSSSSAEERQLSYFLALFSILGKLAKADGTVSREEGQQIIAFLDQFGVTGEQRKFAIRVFNEAKDSSYRAEDFAAQFAEFTRNQRDLRLSLVDMLFRVALADGTFHPREDEMISSVSAVLGISAAELRAIRDRHLGSANHAYSVLGLRPEASDEEVKSTYRRLVHEHHPDRIVAEGMPDEFVDYANQRFQEIQAAWDTIRTERNL